MAERATDLFEKGMWLIVLTNYCNSNGGSKSHEAGLLVMSRLLDDKCLVEDKITSTRQLDVIINDRNY